MSGSCMTDNVRDRIAMETACRATGNKAQPGDTGWDRTPKATSVAIVMTRKRRPTDTSLPMNTDTTREMQQYSSIGSTASVTVLTRRVNARISKANGAVRLLRPGTCACRVSNSVARPNAIDRPSATRGRGLCSDPSTVQVSGRCEAMLMELSWRQASQ